MSLRKRIKTLLPIEQFLTQLNRIHLPGFAGMSLGEVLRFYAKGIQKSSLTNRAAAVSFKFFIALFPGLIFILTLIPYIPIPNFHQRLIIAIEDFIPSEIYPLLKKTIVDIIQDRKTGLLSLGFFFATFFSTNGMNGLMKAFNDSAYITETRSPLRHRWVAFWLTLFTIFTLLFSIIFLVLSNKILLNLLHSHQIPSFLFSLLSMLKWLTVFIVVFFYVATIFYFAPAPSMRWRYFSAGALVSTIFCILFTYLISVYINNFNSYNKVFGLLGTFPIILIWMFLNSLSLIIGFELNVSIRHAEARKNFKVQTKSFNST